MENRVYQRFVLVGRFTSGRARYGFVPGVSSQKKHTCPHNLSTGELLHTPCFPQLHPNRLADELALLDSGSLRTISNDWRMAQVLAHLAHEAFFGEDQRLVEALGYLLGGKGLPLLGAGCVAVAAASGHLAYRR